MRMMLKGSIPVESGNRVVQDGTIAKVIGEVMTHLEPEASYFYSDHGRRGFCMFFDMTESHRIPSTVEPLFINMNAEVELIPVMNAEELKRGIEDFAKGK